MESLESAVLTVLKAIQHRRRTKPAKPARQSRHSQAVITPTPSGGFDFLFVAPEQLASMERGGQKKASAQQQGLVHERTVRMRRQGEPDRRFSLAYAIDPDDNETVIFRVRPVSDRDLGPARILMLSTQQAAGQLNVSRPYIVKLVDEGIFQNVERTRAGHRRIPATEVERVRQEMQTSRRAALNRMETLTSDLRTKELDAAHTGAKRRWTKTA